MNLTWTKEETESQRQEKNGILVGREILSLFSYPMQKLLEKEIISYDDIENQYFTDDQIKNYHSHDLKDLKEEEQEEYIQNIKDRGEDQQEIFEWWIVTEWTYEKLKELGEPVCEWENLSLWGRTCTGQAIALDPTFTDIRKTF